MIRFTIHDMIDVLIDPRVGEPLIRAVNFEIGYFENTQETMAVAPHQIIIKPYDDFTPDSAYPFQTFHSSRGLQGCCFHDRTEGIAVEKQDRGFTIYSDTPNFLINLFIQLLLIENDYTMVHAAAIVDKDNRVTLLPAAGGVGKTALLGYMVQEFRSRHMGDDIVILGKAGNCLSFPRSFVLKEYHRSIYPEVFQRLNLRTKSSYKVKRFLIDNAPFLGIVKTILRRRKIYYKVAHSINLIPHLAEVPVEEIFGENTLAHKGVIERVIFLERYEGSTFKFEEISEDSVCRRLLAILHHEWVVSLEQFLTLGAMEVVDLPNYFQEVIQVIQSGISNKECHIMYIPSNAPPIDLFKSYLRFSRLM
jgi:hypothetical protein